jgi:organic radical activating enzyme
MTEPFCKYIKYQIRYENNTVAPCCWINKKAYIGNLEEVKDYQKWLEGITDWVPECVCCETQEKKGFTSHRQNYNNLFDTDERSAEFQFDTECNAACLICGEYNSTTWEKYNLKNQGKEIKLVDLNRREEIEKRFNYILKTLDFNKLTSVNFLGGEPFKTDSHKIILKKLNEIKGLNEVSVAYVTNASILPDNETIKLWEQCKNVKVNASIDGIESHFEYLRWPLSWKQVLNNLEFYKNIDFIDLCFSHAANPFNIYYHDRYSNWAINFFKGSAHEGENMFSLPFHTGGIINMNCVPPDLAKVIREKYRNYSNSQYFHGILKPNDNLGKLINMFDLNKYKEFIQYINYHDSKRNLDFRKVFPEIEKFFPNEFK